MKYLVLFLVALSSAHAYADPAPSIIPSGMAIPQNQNLAVVDYFSDGRQTGCGLRATGETRDDLWLNVLITVFRKETGATFGVIKVVARQANIKDGAPVLQDGKMTFSDLGKIKKAWIKSDTGKQAMVFKNGESSHSDAYMVNTEFASTVDLLVAISQENFKVGLNRNGYGPDQIFQFDKPLVKEEAGKLSVCMNNLRAAIEENKRKESF
ncbi:MAG: hypothetical protein WCA63_02060 [Gallionella sp.]